MTTRTDKNVNPLARVAGVLVAIVQFAFAGLAFWDLKNRPAGDVRGPKPLWIPVILINWIGPAAYFTAGIRR